MGDELLYLNGSFLPLAEGCIAVEDRGFQLGDGVYEVVKVMNSRLVWWEDHRERLHRNLGEIGLAQALKDHPLDEVLPELIGRSGIVEGMLYLQVTRGCAPRDFFFPEPLRPTVLAYVRGVPLPRPEEILAGVALHPVEDLRWARCDIKSTNLLASVLAKEEARKAGADEALFVGPGGVVREGGSSNVFAVLDGVLRTHPLSNRILGGVTRRHVLEIARREGYPVEERAFTLEELDVGFGRECEVFIASTLRDVMPVVKVGEVRVGNGRPGPVTLRLADLVREEQAVLVGLEPPAPLALQGR